MFGSVDAIFFAMYAGIRIDNDRITVDPYYSPRMNHVSAKTLIGKGILSVEWARNADLVRVSITNNTGEPVYFVQSNKAHTVENGMTAEF